MKLLTADTIITGDGSTLIKDGYVIVGDEGKIESVGEKRHIPEWANGTKKTDYGKATILPGLIDMHAHIGMWQKYKDSAIYEGHPSLISLLAQKELETALSLGVTTVRVPGDMYDHAYSIKKAYEKGYIKGPRYITCNMGITSTGGHGSQMNNMVVEADGEDEIRKAVRSQIKGGADWVKVLASHRTHMCQLTQKELDAAADESHRWLKKCCIHASTVPAVQAAINAGFDTIEHGTFMTVEQAYEAKTKNIGLIPTLIPYISEYDFMKNIIELEDVPDEYKTQISSDYKYFEECTQSYKENFSELVKTGITIAVGTDIVTMKYPITPVAEEMQLMAQHGMETMHVVQCATFNGAKLLGMENELGLLKEGYIADILVAGKDADSDLSALKEVKAVYKSGKIA